MFVMSVKQNGTCCIGHISIQSCFIPIDYSGAMLIRVGNIAFNDMYKLQFDAASPPNPLPHRGGGISNLCLLRF